MPIECASPRSPIARYYCTWFSLSRRTCTATDICTDMWKASLFVTRNSRNTHLYWNGQQQTLATEEARRRRQTKMKSRQRKKNRKKKPGSVFCNVSKTPLSSHWKERLLLGTKNRVFFFCFSQTNASFSLLFLFLWRPVWGMLPKKKGESPIHFFSFFWLPSITTIKKKIWAGPQPPVFFTLHAF